MLIRYFTTATFAALCTSAALAAQAPGATTQQPATQPTTQSPTTQQPTTLPPTAQQPGTQQPGAQQPAAPQQPRTAVTQQATTTVTGCVYREQDVPGRSPNVAERVGVLEDYILAVDAAPAQGQAQAGAGATTTPGAVGTSGAAGAAAASRMYKLEFASGNQLGAMVGKKVEVTGRIDAEAGDAPTAAGTPTSTTDRVIGRDRVDLAEFEVVSIKETAGTCPARPAAQ